MKAEHHRFWILRSEAFLCDSGPQPPRCPEFGDFLEKVIVRVEEKGESRRK
jgi:hypothetical protein